MESLVNRRDSLSWLVLLSFIVNLSLPLLSPTLFWRSIPADRQHGDSGEKLSDGDLSRVAQQKGYMKEEGIDQRVIFVAPTTSIQAMLGGDVQFTGAGSECAREHGARQCAAQGRCCHQRSGSSMAGHATRDHQPQRS